METTLKSPNVGTSKGGATFNILGHAVTVMLRSGERNGNYVFEMVSPPGSGVPPHVHSVEDEVFYILKGNFDVLIGEESFKAGAGDCLNFVRGIPHGYTNVGETDAKTLWFVCPGSSFEKFFDDLSQFPPGPPDPQKLTALCEKHGMKFL